MGHWNVSFCFVLHRPWTWNGLPEAADPQNNLLPDSCSPTLGKVNLLTGAAPSDYLYWGGIMRQPAYRLDRTLVCCSVLHCVQLSSTASELLWFSLGWCCSHLWCTGDRGKSLAKSHDEGKPSINTGNTRISAQHSLIQATIGHKLGLKYRPGYVRRVFHLSLASLPFELFCLTCAQSRRQTTTLHVHNRGRKQQQLDLYNLMLHL